MSAETLVDGLTFLMTARDGTFSTFHGLYHKDTRYLSEFDVSFGHGDPLYIGSDIEDPSHRTIQYGGHPTQFTGIDGFPRRSHARLVLTREQVVRNAKGLYEKISLTNHSSSEFSGSLTVTFDVDYADIFEIRGLERELDRTVGVRAANNAVRYSYSFQAADGQDVRFATTIAFSSKPERLGPGRAEFSVEVEPRDTITLFVAVEPGVGPTAAEPSSTATPGSFRRLQQSTTSISPIVDADPPVIATGNDLYDRTFAQAAAELGALTWRSEWGSIPVAGSPWYVALFGRDSLITAYQTLPVAPTLARGTLRCLRAHQGTTNNDARDEEPGKMFHEFRRGELARTETIPHGPYYGTCDVTLLWIILLHETYQWTGDRRLVDESWESFEAALDWIDRTVGSVPDDPFMYYQPTDQSGLVHKSWRDTVGSVQFTDGRPVRSRTAGVEIQGYLYDALSRASSLIREVKADKARADQYDQRAETLRSCFNDEFWLPDRGYYGAAKTGDGQIVDSLTSNVGQCLWAGIIDEERATAVADRLLSDELFSGWGIRTISTADAGYNPVSYHTGSVWPHDTSLITIGLARYNLDDAVETVAEGLLDASTRFRRHSVPELFCGFDDSTAPIPYPNACRPQAWAAGAPFALLRSLFGFEPGKGSPPRTRRDPTVIASEAVRPILDAWRSPSRLLPDEAP